MLYAKSAHTRLAQASTTKIMTAIVAIENGRLEDRVTVDVDSNRLAETTESTVMGLMPGQTVTLETLLYGLMLPSGNDAAIAIARHIGGSEAALRPDDEREGPGARPAGHPVQEPAWPRRRRPLFERLRPGRHVALRHAESPLLQPCRSRVTGPGMASTSGT